MEDQRLTTEASGTSEPAWTARARRLYERAVFGGDPSAIDLAMAELDVVEADLALARGRILHARFLEDRVRNPEELTLFEGAAARYRARGDRSGEAEALFWMGTFRQVVEKDDVTAVPLLQRAHELATEAGDALTLSYVARHLAFADWAAGRTDAARAWLEESLRLRRAIDFRPGVAAALVALAEFSAEHDQLADSRRLLAEARGVAESSDAAGVLRWIDELEQP